MGDNTGFWLGVLASAPGLIALLWNIFKEKHKAPLEDAGSAVSTSKSAAEALKSYSDEIVRLRAEIKGVTCRIESLEREVESRDALIDAWRIGIRKLLAQLVEAKMIPVWQPDEESPRKPKGGDPPMT